MKIKAINPASGEILKEFVTIKAVVVAQVRALP